MFSKIHAGLSTNEGQTEERILSRTLARVLTDAELDEIAGGVNAYCCQTWSDINGSTCDDNA